jgi:hypothetical protein
MVLALCGLLAAGTGGAMTAQGHSCCPGMSAAAASDHHHDGQDEQGATIPKCCVLGLCGAPAPFAATQSFSPMRRIATRIVFLMLEGAGFSGQPAAPDLRPPIA